MEPQLYITLSGTVISRESPATTAVQALRTPVISSTILARIILAHIYKRFKVLLWIYATLCNSVSDRHENRNDQTE